MMLFRSDDAEKEVLATPRGPPHVLVGTLGFQGTASKLDENLTFDKKLIPVCLFNTLKH